jgi:hypothetical protein
VDKSAPIDNPFKVRPAAVIFKIPDEFNVKSAVLLSAI